MSDEDSSETLKRTTSFEHRLPPSKLMWFPEHGSSNPDLLISSSDTLKIWELSDSGEVELRSSLWNTDQEEFSAPLTSFDWHARKLELIFTSSIDTTCSIWDITKGCIVNQLIAHDREVLDINLNPDATEFATVGADGSLRQFDVRDLRNSFILFESREPLVRVSWNKLNPYLIAFASLEQNSVIVVDIRKPFNSAYTMIYHDQPVTNIRWSVSSA